MNALPLDNGTPVPGSPAVHFITAVVVPAGKSENDTTKSVDAGNVVGLAVKTHLGFNTGAGEGEGDGVGVGERAVGVGVFEAETEAEASTLALASTDEVTNGVGEAGHCFSCKQPKKNKLKPSKTIVEAAPKRFI